MILRMHRKLNLGGFIQTLMLILFIKPHLVHMQTQEIFPKKQNIRPQAAQTKDGTQFFFPQQPPTWSQSTLLSGLREPVNVPVNSIITQEDANFLEGYLRNHFNSPDNTHQPTVNLASLNNRPIRPENYDAQKLSGSPMLIKDPTFDPLSSLKSQEHNDRADSTISRRDDFSTKKGKVDDVVLFKTSPQIGKYFPQPAPVQKQLVKPNLFNHKLAQNCITRSAPIASRCEDHLIKRLSQDAAEGRTVMDVGRRVCCALFWHKDCINRIVVETCPDSSPIAADYLLGSRKLDLTFSCQKYNRDGCNAAPSRINGINYSLSLTLIICLLLKIFNNLL